ncbi:unnamed protein product [Arabis nemorensis]|uniref:Zinc finger GRF-type domain-containing protein n=1 Tax=Arabis nemorensis TaxID=586526 RepID=A0A565BEN7_9BRAS|nr:unnamed protein product [Arabis nemorensis]
MGKRRLSIFGSYDTGSNNNYSSSLDQSHFVGESLSDYEVPVTRQPVQKDFPTMCYCGADAVVKNYTFGQQNGRRYYTCAGNIYDGDCHIWKFFDDAVVEEILILKNKVSGLEARVERYDKEVNDLKQIVLQLQTKVNEIQTNL